MKFIGNYAEWINPDLVEFMKINDGTARPGGGANPDSEEFRKAKEHGYDLNKVYWYIFEPDTFPFDIKIPFDDQNEYMWWGIKMNPGNFMPVHRDPHTYDPKFYSVKRYWMALQDYEPGHVFIYNKELLKDIIILAKKIIFLLFPMVCLLL
jgi:hypothetical protein